MNAMLPVRRAVSPYARRLARERGIPLEALTGSGPGGRIVAVDVEGFVAAPPPMAAAVGGPQASALAATVGLKTIRELLGAFAASDTAFDLEDVVLRAAGCALDDVGGAADLPGQPVAVEARLPAGKGQLVFSDIRKGSLAPLRARRLHAIEAGEDASAQPALMSLRLVEAGDIRPVVMPLLPGRRMRLVLVAGPDTGECLLAFDAALVDEDVAADLLGRFKAYLEVPLRLLA